MSRSLAGVLILARAGLPLWAVCLASGAIAAAAEKVITVGPSGADYFSLQAAVAAAEPGQVIEVGRGTYRENVRIDKSVVIRGGDMKPVVDAGRQGSALIVSADKVTVEGLELINSGGKWGDAGIVLKSKQNVIRGNTVSKNHTGIMLQESDENTITGNQVRENHEDGICLVGSSRNKVAGNTSSGNKHAGIWIKAHLSKGPPIRCLENVLEDNTVDGNVVFGIGLYTGADKNQVTKNRVTKNRDAGLLLDCGPMENMIAENLVRQNIKAGILMTTAGPRNTIKANQVTDGENGIVVLSTSGNTFVQNDVRNHRQYGIRLAEMSPVHQPSITSVLYHNNLANNKTNAYDLSGKPFRFPTVPGVAAQTSALDAETLKAMSAPNRWDNGSEGNYYSDFDEPSEGCVDADHNGIADKGHPIPGGGAIDRFPLVAPFKPEQPRIPK